MPIQADFDAGEQIGATSSCPNRLCQFRAVHSANSRRLCQHSSCRQDREDNRGFPAYATNAALRREHVGIYGMSIVESFAVRHSRGSSVPLIQCSSVHASVDIDP